MNWALIVTPCRRRPASRLPPWLGRAGSDNLHHRAAQANVVTTDDSDWATNCPKYRVTAVQIFPSNGPSGWQEAYEVHAAQTRRILGHDSAMEPAE